MITRTLTGTDVPILHRINDRCHPNDSFPSFKNFYPPIIVITDDKNRIITAGGVEKIAEAVTITDNEFSSHVRTTALQELLRGMLLTCGRIDQDYLHAFIDDHDETWIRTVQKVGFKSMNKETFYIEVNHG